MGDVSGRVTGFLLDALHERAIDVDAVLEEKRLSSEAFADSSTDVSWEAFLDLLDAIEAYGGPELVESLGLGLDGFVPNRPLRAIARFAWTEQQFWRLLTDRAAPNLSRVPSFALETLKDGRLRLTIRIPDERRGSQNLMRLIAGAIRATPRFLGGDRDADMEAELSPHLSCVTIRPVLATSMVSRLGRRIVGLVVGGPAYDELERRHRNAAATTALLEERNRALATLQAVADSITHSIDFAGTAQRIVDAIVEHTRYAGVLLYTVDEAGEFLDLSGTHSPNVPVDVPRRFPVDFGVGGRALRERRVVWAPDELGHSDLHPAIQAALRDTGLKSFVAVPLVFHDTSMGVLGLSGFERRTLSADEKRSLLALGKTAAAALMSARHVARIEREVSERERAEEEVRRSEEHLRQIAENVDVVVYLLDARTDRVLYLSPTFERMTGHPGDAIRKQASDLLEWVHPEDRDRVALVIERDRGRVEYEIEYRMVRPDGALLEVIERTRLVVDSSGRALRTAGFIQDVTQMRALERQLLHSQKMEVVGRLAGGIAHDFNNLLTVILGHGEVLRDRLEDSAVERGMASEIVGVAESAAGLTRRLLTLAHRQPVRPEVLDLADVVCDLAPMLRSLVGENVELAIDIAPDTVTRSERLVRIDRSQLEQVLANLGVNARDAMPEGGRLSVGVRASRPRRVILCVRDTGVGMDSAVRAHVFEPFFSTKEPGQGTGIGLATVEAIVEQAGGEIRLESALGRGTCFEIELPVAEGTLEDLSSPKPIATGGSETILLVEDQDDVRGVAARALEAGGYSVLTARDAYEALEQLGGAGSKIDLLVTDIVMPGMSGIQLAAQAADLRRDLPVLFISGYSGEDTNVAVEGAVLQKPFTLSALGAAVRERLDWETG